MENNQELFRIDDIYCWIEQEESVHVKAVTKDGDPVELTSEEARRLGETLIKFANQIDGHN